MNPTLKQIQGGAMNADAMTTTKPAASATPETDAELKRIEDAEELYHDRHDCFVALLAFTRRLERERDEARAERDARWTPDVVDYYEKLEAEYGRVLFRLGAKRTKDDPAAVEKHVMALKADRDSALARLRECEALQARIAALEFLTSYIERNFPDVMNCAKQRAAIDAARKTTV